MQFFLSISLDTPKIMNYNPDFGYSISWLNYCLLCLILCTTEIHSLPHWNPRSFVKHKLAWNLSTTSPFIFWVKLPFKVHKTFHLASLPFILNTCPPLWPSQSPSPKAHYPLLSPWLCACGSLCLGLPHALIFPATTTHSSRVTAGIILLQKAVHISSHLPPTCIR